MKQNYKEEEKIYLNPVGLANLSRYQRINNYKSFKKASLFNSCYMNASIQCLFRIDGFVKKIIQANEGSLVLATKKLIYDMQKPNNNYNQCSVLDIKKAMGEKNEKYNDEFQEDANEFITNYLNYLMRKQGILQIKSIGFVKNEMKNFLISFIESSLKGMELLLL